MRLIKRYFRLFPERLIRIPKHFGGLISGTDKFSSSWYDWPFDFVFQIFDLFGVPEFYEGIMSNFRPNCRALNLKEEQLILEYYSGLLDRDEIRINDSIGSLTEKSAQAFVTFNTINFKGSISDAIFIHELMHVYQYQKYGSMYIYRALKAQNSKQAYDYGGLYGLSEAALKDVKLNAFNFEQQAMIMEDYFRFINKSNPMAREVSKKIEHLYISFYKQIFDDR